MGIKAACDRKYIARLMGSQRGACTVCKAGKVRGQASRCNGESREAGRRRWMEGKAE